MADHRSRHRPVINVLPQSNRIAEAGCSTAYDRSQELAVLGHRQRRQGQCQSVLADRNRQSPWPRTLPLPRPPFRRVAKGAERRTDRSTAALERPARLIRTRSRPPYVKLPATARRLSLTAYRNTNCCPINGVHFIVCHSCLCPYY